MLVGGYATEGVKLFADKMNKTGRKLGGEANLVIHVGYYPELYVSLVLNYNNGNYYHTIIGSLRWAVNIGIIGIHVEVALRYCYLYQP